MTQNLHILILNGPNLQFQGTREPAVYGATTWAQLQDRLMTWAQTHQVQLTVEQTNDEGSCVAVLHAAAQQGCHAVVMNPAGLTHTSVVLRDAVAAATLPVIEVHISNIAAREPFRAHSLIAPVAAGSIFGFGLLGYEVALEAALRVCHKNL